MFAYSAKYVICNVQQIVDCNCNNLKKIKMNYHSQVRH